MEWRPWVWQGRGAQRVDDALTRLAHRWALFLHTHRALCVIIPGMLGVALSTGLLLIPYREINDTEELFTPSKSQASVDRETLLRLWPLDQKRYLPGKSLASRIGFDILCFSSKQDGNVLDSDVLSEIERLNQYLLHNLTVNGRSYSDLCLSYDGVCFGNEQVEMMRRRDKLFTHLGRLYPVMGPETSPAYTAYLIGTPTLDPQGRVTRATVLRLLYFLKQDRNASSSAVDGVSLEFMYGMQEYVEHNFTSDFIYIHFAHAESMEQGMNETSDRFIPNFIISLGLLGLFSIICNTVLKRSPDGRFTGIDVVRSRPWHAVAALVSSTLALGSSFGTLLLLGYHYNSIANTIVFLVLSIGLDDMFILVAAWEASRETKTGPKLADSCRRAIVSVTITSLTDAVCFAIGGVSPLTAVQIFCAYATLAVVYDFVFQLSFFLAIMDFLGEAELGNRHALFFYKLGDVVQPADSKTLPAWRSKRDPDHDSAVARFFRNCYGPLIFHPVSKAATLLLGIAYVAMCITGFFRLSEGLNPANIVMDDHHLASYFKSMEEEFFQQGMILHVAVTRAPDLSTPRGRALVSELAYEVENTPYTMGYNGTVLWLRSFLAFLDSISAPVNDAQWNRQVQDWVEFSNGRSQWESDIIWDSARLRVTAFKFQVGMRKIAHPYDQRVAVRTLRAIMGKERYRPLEALAFNELFPFVEQYEMVRPTTTMSLSLGIGCMAVIGLFLVPSTLGAVLITLSIVSIDAGVLGFMGWWGVKLDAVSMICLTMATGFAVDLTAHITYAFLAADLPDPKNRAIHALQHVGWPVLQGGLSTLLGTTILSSVDAYIVQTFFKTVFLVIGFGLLHSLLILPLTLSLLNPGSRRSSTPAPSTASILSTPSTVSSNVL